MRPRIAIMATLWVSGAAIALFPIVSSGVLGNFYGTNGMCFPLHVHDPFAPGWQYSAFVFIGVNSVAMVTIMCCYAALFVSIQVRKKRYNVNRRCFVSYLHAPSQYSVGLIRIKTTKLNTII